MLFVKQGFLHALAFFVAGFIFKYFTVFVGQNEFVVLNFDIVFFQPTPVAVAQNAQIALDRNEFVEGRNQKMSGTYGRITDLNAVYNPVCFGTVFNFVVELIQRIAAPAFGFVELLHHRPANGFVAHVHGYESGRKKRSIAIAVYLFEDETKNRCVNQVFVVFLNFARSIATEIISVEKFK